MKLIDIKKMSYTERLQAMEALWDSILYEGKDLNTPEWHKTILDERNKKIVKGEAQFISLKDLKKLNR
jgi:hypothetical protein